MRFLNCTAAAIVVLTCASVSCDRINVAGVQVDSRFKGYIPPQSKVLAGVDFDKLKQTDFYKRHQTQFDIPQLNQLPAEIGMDPRKDVSSLLVAWTGTDFLSMARGTYSPEQLERRLSGVTQAEKYKDLTLYGDGKRDVVFLPKGVALVGSAVLLKAAVNDYAAGSRGISEDLEMRMARLDKSAQIWEVSSGVIPLENITARSDMASALSNITGYVNGTAVSVTVSGGVNLDVKISCISDEGSQRVHDALRGVIGFARLSTRDDQLDQLKIWDSIHVDKQAKEVHVTADLPADLTDKVLNLLPALTRRI